MKFSSLSGTSINQQIARELARSILSGDLSEGALLPNEMSLCEQFEVSRTALREALKLLISKGLIESRTKVGTWVRPRGDWNLLDAQLLEWLDDARLNVDFYLHFLKLRRAVEPEACALAALHATEEQRIKLTQLFNRMLELSVTFEPNDWVDVDNEFHRTIFISSGNPFFIPFGNIMRSMFRLFFVYSSHEGGVCIAEHKAIYDAIMEGSSEKAREASKMLLVEDKHRLIK